MFKDAGFGGKLDRPEGHCVNFRRQNQIPAVKKDRFADALPARGDLSSSCVMPCDTMSVANELTTLELVDCSSIGNNVEFANIKMILELKKIFNSKGSIFWWISEG
jgi:hypothetical protein